MKLSLRHITVLWRHLLSPPDRSPRPPLRPINPLKIKETNELLIAVLSGKHRNAIHLMAPADMLEPSTMIERVVHRSACKMVDRYFEAIEATIDHRLR